VRPRRDSRRELRRSVEVNATVSVNGRGVPARTRDISRSGICLVTETEIRRDTELMIELVLSLGADAFSEPLLVAGRSIWCTPMFGKYQIGVVFIDVNAERHRFLDLFMRFLDGELNPVGHDPPSAPLEPTEIPEDKDDPFRP
jgi:hypothetical protein